ncbi:MAG: DHH family phosphoesterase [Phycisphaerae bacterium]|nr:DHH family phosphoesterase [Phycisphaerae bacterium]
MPSEFNEIVEHLRAAKSLLLLTHVHPDGDGLGAMVALSQAARAAGKTAVAMADEWIPWRYTFLFKEMGEEFFRYTDSFDKEASAADLIVVLDTASRSQLNDLANKLDALRDKTIVIDHHQTNDDLGKIRWTDTSAAAVGVMTLELIEALDWPIDDLAARALATAIVSDTGWLRFSNTDSRCLQAMAKLVARGVATDTLYRRIYECDRPERLRLLQRILASLELHHDGRLAVMSIRKNDFAETGARPDETENFVNEAMRLADVEVAILLTETPQDEGPDADRVRVSLRSREQVDVARLAKQFGGGGHARAAGLRENTDLDNLKTRLIRAVGEALGR